MSFLRDVFALYLSYNRGRRHGKREKSSMLFPTSSPKSQRVETVTPSQRKENAPKHALLGAAESDALVFWKVKYS